MPDKVRELAERIAAKHGITVEALLGRGRTKTVAEARHELMALLRGTFAFSFPEIGRIVGRDHSTVMYALRKRESAGVLKCGAPVREDEKARTA
jgi:chromosomal replication initiator protein